MITDNKLKTQTTFFSNKEICVEASLNWLVVKTKARHEKTVAQQLEALGYNVYLPLQTTMRLWSDRKKKVQTPLIPSVIFVENPMVDKTAMYTLPGFHTLLKINGKLAEVRPHEIEQLRLVVGEQMDIEPSIVQQFLAGEEVEIIAGPLCGHFAKALDNSTNYRILLEIPTLGWNYSVSVPKNTVRKIKPLG